MLQGIEIIFAERVTMLTSLKKKGYEIFFREFERDHEHYFVEMREYAEQAASGEAAAMDRAGADGMAPEEKAGAGIQENAETGSRTEGGSGISEEVPGTMEGIIEGLREYAACRTALCERIYRPEIIQDMPEMLPEEYRGAYAISSLLEMTEKE